MANKILKPKKSGILKVYIPFSLLVLLVCLAGFGSRFQYLYDKTIKFADVIYKDVLVFGVWLIIFVILMVILLKNNYYEYSNSYLIHHRFKNEVTYNFNNVVYIDEKYTIKHKTLLFYTDKGKELYLVCDQNMELLKIFQNSCKNLIDYHTFIVKYKGKKDK